MKRLTYEGRFCDLAMCQEPYPCKYHDTGCSQRNTWERLKAIEDILGEDYDLDALRRIVDASREFRLLVMTERLAVAMSAGSRAIRNSKRYDGTTYVYDVFGDKPKELSYYEATNILSDTAETFLQRSEADGT